MVVLFYTTITPLYAGFLIRGKNIVNIMDSEILLVKNNNLIAPNVGSPIVNIADGEKNIADGENL